MGWADIDARINCPFYRGAQTRPNYARVYCERFDGAAIHLYLRSPAKLEAFKLEHCAGDFTSCMLYKGIMQFQYGQDPWGEFTPPGREEKEDHK